LLLKAASHCQRKLWSEGHTAAGWGTRRSIELLLHDHSHFVQATGGC